MCKTEWEHYFMKIILPSSQTVLMFGMQENMYGSIGIAFSVELGGKTLIFMNNT